MCACACLARAVTVLGYLISSGKNILQGKITSVQCFAILPIVLP